VSHGRELKKTMDNTENIQPPVTPPVALQRACSAAGGNGGAQDQPEKKWCAWCGVWGDHTSGGCDDLHEGLLRRRAEDEKQPNVRISHAEKVK
jgi:hypothetical protein